MIELIGGFGVVASIIFGFKSGNTDFFILAGLIFVGICILEIPKIMVKIVTTLAESLSESLQDFKNNLNNVKSEE